MSDQDSIFVSIVKAAQQSQKRLTAMVRYGFISILLAGVMSVSGTDTDIPVKEIGLDVHGLPVFIPLYGAGTWQYNDTVAYESVCKSLFAGITLIDTAYAYGNEKGVGKAIKDCYQGNRQDLFVMTKIPGGLGSDEVFAAHKQNLIELGLDYVDHLMTHFPSDWDEKQASKELRQEEWLALEKIYYSGEARSIGISHYCTRHIDDVLEVASVLPSVNQVEYHIGSGDVDDVIQKCKDEGITFMSFSPLCGPCAYEPSDSLINGDLVSEIASVYGVSGAQVSLRFIVQQALKEGNNIGSVIPKSNNEDHIRSNMNIFDFELSAEDMKRLQEATKPVGQAGDCEVP